MSFYENLVMGMQRNYSRHYGLYDAGKTPYELSRKPALPYPEQIRRLAQQIKVEGYTLVPLSLYFKGSMVKVELGLCKGKKLYDKRAATAERDAKRAIDRAIKSQSR